MHHLFLATTTTYTYTGCTGINRKIEINLWNNEIIYNFLGNFLILYRSKVYLSNSLVYIRCSAKPLLRENIHLILTIKTTWNIIEIDDYSLLSVCCCGGNLWWRILMIIPKREWVSSSCVIFVYFVDLIFKCFYVICVYSCFGIYIMYNYILSSSSCFLILLSLKWMNHPVF